MKSYAHPNVDLDDTSFRSGKRVTPARRRSNLKGLRLPVCETGKLRYRSREQAGDALAVARRCRVTAEALGQESRRRENRAYVCPVCGGFHLTSQPLRTQVGA